MEFGPHLRASPLIGIDWGTYVAARPFSHRGPTAPIASTKAASFRRHIAFVAGPEISEGRSSTAASGRDGEAEGFPVLASGMITKPKTGWIETPYAQAPLECG